MNRIRFRFAAYKRPTNKAKCMIYLEFSHMIDTKQHRKKLKTGITVSSPSHWNQKRQQIIKNAPHSSARAFHSLTKKKR